MSHAVAHTSTTHCSYFKTCPDSSLNTASIATSNMIWYRMPYKLLNTPIHLIHEYRPKNPTPLLIYLFWEYIDTYMIIIQKTLTIMSKCWHMWSELIELPSQKVKVNDRKPSYSFNVECTEDFCSRRPIGGNKWEQAIWQKKYIFYLLTSPCLSKHGCLICRYSVPFRGRT